MCSKTGTYKLLFCVLQEEPEELECVYAEILDPVVTSNSYYGNELVSTLTTYLGNDASTAKTATDLFAHRHTIRYHLDHSRSYPASTWRRRAKTGNFSP